MGNQLMVTTNLTAAKENSSLSNPLLAATALVAGTTSLGITLGVLCPGLTGSLAPHPTLTGSISEAASIFFNNLRVLVAPFALWALGFPATRNGRRAGDLLVFTLTVLNTLEVGIELGHWRLDLVSYVPQLPLEWAGLTVGVSAWLTAGNGQANPRHMSLLAVWVVVLIASAAAVETWCTPHAKPQGAHVNTLHGSRVRRTAVSSHPDFAPTTALSLQGHRRLPSPHRRSVPLGLLVGADRAHIHHRPQQEGSPNEQRQPNRQPDLRP
jgi:hypothetical protein